VAGDREGGRVDEEDLHHGEEEPGSADERREPPDGDVPEAERRGEDGGEGEAPRWVRAFIGARRVRIDPARKRAEYMMRLEELMAEIDGIIDDPKGFKEIQVRAMDVLIRAVRMCYRIVRDVDVERLEDELEGLKEENLRAEGARGELGYEIEG
jgi:hypothetical protein